MLAPTAPRTSVLADDRAALAAGAAPGVADPPETITTEIVVARAETDGPNDDVMPRAVVRHDGQGWYASCGCGFTTGYCDTTAPLVRVADLHWRTAHGG